VTGRACHALEIDPVLLTVVDIAPLRARDLAMSLPPFTLADGTPRIT
jgi:hypothetical protein